MNAWTERRSSLSYTGAITNPQWACTEPEGQINTKGGSDDELRYPFSALGRWGFQFRGLLAQIKAYLDDCPPLSGAQCFWLGLELQQWFAIICDGLQPPHSCESTSQHKAVSDSGVLENFD